MVLKAGGVREVLSLEFPLLLLLGETFLCALIAFVVVVVEKKGGGERIVDRSFVVVRLRRDLFSTGEREDKPVPLPNHLVEASVATLFS